MNILREIRKTKEKSLSVRIILALMFCAVFIVNTYAWFAINKEVNLGGLNGDVYSWDVAYYVEEEEILDQIATFVIDEAYPGMPKREDTVYIYNMGKASTQIYYELLSVKVFGVEILNELKANKEIRRTGNTTSIFSTDANYPFDISYTYGSNYLKGKYVDDETTPKAVTTFKFNVSWPYEEGATEEEIVTKDILDTKFGKEAYEYYESGNDKDNAVEVQVRITSKMIDPALTADDIEIKDNDIEVKTYGKDGEGIVSLKLRDEYLAQGYYIEYVVVKQGDEFSPDSEWKKENLITGLSETDTIYARVTDGTRIAEGIVTINLNDLFEKYTENAVTELTKYTDVNGQTAYIPEGFKIGESSTINTIENGLVIEDANGNQFVWVPVKDVVYNEGSIPTSASAAAADTIFYRPMVRYQAGSDRYYEGMYYTFVDKTSYATLSYRLGQSYYSEPRLVTNYAPYTWDIENVKFPAITRDIYYVVRSPLNFSSPEEFGKYMNEEYTNMVNSVKKYGGFYVGRYETSLSGTTAQSKPGQTPAVTSNWYNMYQYQDSNRHSSNPYYNNSQYVSSMMRNSQWNAMLNWILTGSDAEKINDKTIGNLGATINKTGETLTDRINNIYDLTGNAGEWVQAGHSTPYRAYRGGSIYNTSGYYKEGPASQIYHTASDSGGGNFIGSRMTLYIKDQSDKTPPTLAFRTGDELDVQTNSIKAKVEAQDTGSGISKYVYSISADGGNTYKDYTGYGNTYTFEGLTQNSNYYVKVKVYDNAGNVAEIAYPDIITTKILEIVEGDIKVDAQYGKNGAGVVYIEIAESLADQGYTTEYQKVASGGTFSETGTWTKGQQINNLSVGDTVYARLTDGINVGDSSSMLIHNIKQLETFSEAKTTLTEYVDSNGDKAYVPTGFKVGTSDLNNTIENGLVIEHATTGDQFVWVPVKHAIYNSNDGTIPTSETNANKNKDADGNVVSYKPMVKYQNGYTASTEKQYFEGIAYTSWGASLVKGSYAHRSATDYALGKSSYREPSLVTGNSSQYTWEYKAGAQYDGSDTYYSNILKFDSAEKFGEYMNTEYTNMILSVNKYGGFYVGRYETSLSGTTVKSQYNTTPMASINWYNMYYNQDSKRNPNNPYYGNTEITASMIWGSQYDAVLNWVLDEGRYADKVYTVTGNHSGSRRSTGVTGNDFANNVIDLCSNVREWTQEAYSTQNRVYRGGTYDVDDNFTASVRSTITSTYTSYVFGSRFTLYVK